MLTMLTDLIKHKGFANAAILKAIHQHDPAAQDPELRSALHHILVANRFWLSLILEREFDLEAESKIPDSLAGFSTRYRETHDEEITWISGINESALERTVETSFLPGQRYSAAQGMMQVCMHTQGHRSQCASRLRILGGTPPLTDFVIWLKDRTEPDWL